jgi:hypothetical protein
VTTYFSRRGPSPGGTAVYAADGARARALDPRTDLADFGAARFSWGHRGPGPAQLALAILAEELGDEAALANRRRLEAGLVAGQPGDVPLEVTSAQVEGAVENS